MALFDTDVLIDNLRGKQGARDVILRFQGERNYCSVITSGEILFGMRPNEAVHTLQLLDLFNEIPITKELSREASEVKQRAKGHGLELYDCLIAATALSYKQVLVTRNAKHYPDKRLKIFVPQY
ncbi:MAG: type II toxin-antitoxin system VapC family toxin [Candidatus Margulisiibacteriota bacterium]|jgi:hypothetical protein